MKVSLPLPMTQVMMTRRVPSHMIGAMDAKGIKILAS
jgi:hypothetical protein